MARGKLVRVGGGVWRKNFLCQLPPPHKVCLQGEALRKDMLRRSEAQNSTDGLYLIAHTNVSVLLPQNFFFFSNDNYDNKQQWQIFTAVCVYVFLRNSGTVVG